MKRPPHTTKGGASNKLPASLNHPPIMKTNRILTVVATIGLLMTPALRVHAESRAAEAIEQLDRAKRSEHPIEHLEKAKLELEMSDRVKRGEKWEALIQVNEAIEAVRKGEHRMMEKHIERAIHEIKEGKR